VARIIAFTSEGAIAETPGGINAWMDVGYTDMAIGVGGHGKLTPDNGGPASWRDFLSSWNDQIHARAGKSYAIVKTADTGSGNEFDVNPADYHDGAAWDVLLANWRLIVRRLKLIKFDGVFFDTEDYAYKPPGVYRQQKWPLVYGPYTDPNATKWAAAVRGRQFFDVLYEEWPQCPVVSYFMTWPGGHRDWVMHREYGNPYPNEEGDAQLWFWRGAAGSPNHGEWHNAESLFYKVTHYPVKDTSDRTWRSTLEFDWKKQREYLVKTFGAARASKIWTPPMIAISQIEDGVGPHKELKSVAYVREQLMESARACELAGGGLFVNYHYGSWTWSETTPFSYDPYEADIKAAAALELPPEGSTTPTDPGDATVTVTVRDSTGLTQTMSVPILRDASVNPEQPTGTRAAPNSVGYQGALSDLAAITGPAGAPAGTEWTSPGYLTVNSAMTLEGRWIRGPVYCAATELTLRRCVVEGALGLWFIVVMANGGKLTIEDSTIRYGDGSSFNPGASGAGTVLMSAGAPNELVMRNVDLSGNADGVQCSDSTLLDRVWIHNLARTGSVQDGTNTHNDGIQCFSGDLHVVRSYLDTEAVSGYSNAAIFLQGAGIDQVTIEDTYLNGGGYTLYAQNGQVRLIDVDYGPDHLWGEQLIEEPAVLVPA
jgi:hypothetical protein